jgi:hypothetical protein
MGAVLWSDKSRRGCLADQQRVSDVGVFDTACACAFTIDRIVHVKIEFTTYALGRCYRLSE